jgi:hypothetical protein
MTLDYQRVQEQVHELGKNAAGRQKENQEKRLVAENLLHEYARQFERLRQRVEQGVRFEQNLRCAVPPDPTLAPQEALDSRHPLPTMPAQVTVIAADGSQIPLDRHAEVEYCLINVGAVRQVMGCSQAPQTHIQSQLLFDEALWIGSGTITDATLAVMRDRYERTILADLLDGAADPVITFTDGQMELWGALDSSGDTSQFARQLEEYLNALRRMCAAGAVSAGYVVKPHANLVVRLLEVMKVSEIELADIRHQSPLRGATDLHMFCELLEPGERSAVFSLQSFSARQYRDELALHFFYLNVGRAGHPALARIEIPLWVAADAQKLDHLHAVLVAQCRMMGSRPYPYLLHRAHETAVVSLEERDQVTQMIVHELYKHGVEVGEKSEKQGLKEVQGRTGYKK